MKRLGAALTMMMAMAALPASAGSSALKGGVAEWFYFCGGEGQTMNIAIRHLDRSFTYIALRPHQRLRMAVQRGDVEAWRCGVPVPRDAGFYTITTLN